MNIRGALLCSDEETAHALALHGTGIVLKTLWDVAVRPQGRPPAAGAARPAPRPAPLHAVYPHTRQLAPRVRRFVEFIGERPERT